MFVSVLQTGGATGLAIVTSIQTSVEVKHGGPRGFEGRAAGLWFLVAFIGLMMCFFVLFMKSKPVGGTMADEEVISPIEDVEKKATSS